MLSPTHLQLEIFDAARYIYVEGYKNGRYTEAEMNKAIRTYDGLERRWKQSYLRRWWVNITTIPTRIRYYEQARECRCMNVGFRITLPGTGGKRFYWRPAIDFPTRIRPPTTHTKGRRVSSPLSSAGMTETIAVEASFLSTSTVTTQSPLPATMCMGDIIPDKLISFQDIEATASCTLSARPPLPGPVPLFAVHPVTHPYTSAPLLATMLALIGMALLLISRTGLFCVGFRSATRAFAPGRSPPSVDEDKEERGKSSRPPCLEVTSVSAAIADVGAPKPAADAECRLSRAHVAVSPAVANIKLRTASRLEADSDCVERDSSAVAVVNHNHNNFASLSFVQQCWSTLTSLGADHSLKVPVRVECASRDQHRHSNSFSTRPQTRFHITRTIQPEVTRSLLSTSSARSSPSRSPRSIRTYHPPSTHIRSIPFPWHPHHHCHHHRRQSSVSRRPA